MKHPYAEFEGSALWKLIDNELSELERNRDLALTTARPYVIGSLCRALIAPRGAFFALDEYEALVLFELLTQREESDSPLSQDPVDQLVLSRVQAALQRQLVAPFDPEYDALVSDARARILREKES